MQLSTECVCVCVCVCVCGGKEKLVCDTYNWYNLFQRSFYFMEKV